MPTDTHCAFLNLPCADCARIPAQVQQSGLPSTRFHDLRHFYASTLVAANLNPKVIQARLGRATMNTYSHLFPDSDDLGRGALDPAFAASEIKTITGKQP
jgi:integrase